MPMPIDPMAIDELYRKYMYGRLADDEEANAARTVYRDSLQSLQKNRKESLQGLSYNMADRGLTHSGINMQEGLNTNATYDTGQTQLGNTMTSTLARIAKKRLLDDAEYNRQRAMY